MFDPPRLGTSRRSRTRRPGRPTRQCTSRRDTWTAATRPSTKWGLPFSYPLKSSTDAERTPTSPPPSKAIPETKEGEAAKVEMTRSATARRASEVGAAVEVGAGLTDGGAAVGSSATLGSSMSDSYHATSSTSSSPSALNA